MAYIALKPCRFAGQAFKIGETVPEELISAGAAKNLVKMGKISSMDGEAPKSSSDGENSVSVTVKAEEGNMTLELSKDGLQQIFDALTANVENAEKVVKEMTDNDALILLHMSDNRKSIMAAVEARAKALNEPAEEETPDEEQENSEDMAGEE